MEWRQEHYLITDQPDRMNLEVIHHFLSHSSYWAKGISRETVEKSLKYSLCFGLFHDDKQIGFARAVTDRTTFAYLADVFVIEPYRGQGLGKWLVACILEHPDLQGLRRLLLATQDGHGLYQQYGFAALAKPERFMEIHYPDRYS
jgi:GNAT superfamily N-acetyltransferase